MSGFVEREEEMSPCPFCGNGDLTSVEIKGLTRIICNECGCIGPENGTDWNDRYIDYSEIEDEVEDGVKKQIDHRYDAIELRLATVEGELMNLKIACGK